MFPFLRQVLTLSKISGCFIFSQKIISSFGIHIEAAWAPFNSSMMMIINHVQMFRHICAQTVRSAAVPHPSRTQSPSHCCHICSICAYKQEYFVGKCIQESVGAGWACMPGRLASVRLLKGQFITFNFLSEASPLNCIELLTLRRAYNDLSLL